MLGTIKIKNKNIVINKYIITFQKLFLKINTNIINKIIKKNFNIKKY